MLPAQQRTIVLCVRQRCGVPVAKETTTAAHAMCAAAGWYVELTQRGLLQELGKDCGHMAARNASKQLMCVQCGLFKTRGAYKTGQWTLRGDRLCKECQERNADRCLGLAAPMHAPVVLRVSAFNVAAFNQNMIYIYI